ncbi:MAG: dihydropteroate synthase [Bacteroidota bacterium]|nr:dihydropteroate synthase [Bacteroidota bacterium]
MGILNLSPESFYKGSIYKGEIDVSKAVNRLIFEGVDIVDIGAMSSRPGSKSLSEKEEMDRLLPTLKEIRREFPEVKISVDVSRSVVIRACIDEGADMINDISGSDINDSLLQLMGNLNIAYVMMHMRETPETMQHQTNLKYENIMREILLYFAKKIDRYKSFGLTNIFVDPGFGFSKDLEQNYTLLSNLNLLSILDKPILVGISRKSMIYKLCGGGAEEALAGTIAANTLALMMGASILRVHDVKEAKDAITIYKKVKPKH